MEFRISPLPLAGAFLLEMPRFSDARGSFVKTFHGPAFEEFGGNLRWEESYYSLSRKGVIRGLHFQVPPHDHAKLVHCPQGSLIDLIFDMRKSSPSYGQYCSLSLSASNARAVFIPPGIAHGFRSLEEGTLTHYMVSSVYSPDHDRGILFNSIGFDWGEVDEALISPRDLGFPAWKNLDSPFG